MSESCMMCNNEVNQLVRLMCPCNNKEHTITYIVDRLTEMYQSQYFISESVCNEPSGCKEPNHIPVPMHVKNIEHIWTRELNKTVIPTQLVILVCRSTGHGDISLLAGAIILTNIYYNCHQLFVDIIENAYQLMCEHNICESCDSICSAACLLIINATNAMIEHIITYYKLPITKGVITIEQPTEHHMLLCTEMLTHYRTHSAYFKNISYTSIFTHIGKQCDYCNSKDAKLLCSGCKRVYYCSQICQKKIWKQHKSVCIAKNATIRNTCIHCKRSILCTKYCDLCHTYMCDKECKKKHECAIKFWFLPSAALDKTL